ncbi:hypothetical protein FHS42_003995 [Streptomyces zagrosensis]|uniref:Uncharacterized protein n=1 Tax=Streptomyces zagrosensis TaxID=1042984 RepID=A0A7W9UZE2_9ACTN|nr:hypothetical protein [Streptomyces zagrosensis]
MTARSSTPLRVPPTRDAFQRYRRVNVGAPAIDNRATRSKL